MLDTLRNAAKGWVAKTLIFMLAASFGVWGIADVFRGYNAGALAFVGSEEITGEQFTRAFNTALQRLAKQSGPALSPEDARKLGVDRQILNTLIQSAAIDDQGRAMKLAVGDELIVKVTQANPAFKDAAGQFDRDLLLSILQSNGLNEQMYLAGERQELLRQAITGSVDGHVPASKTLVEAFYRHRNEQRDARYFVVKAAESEVTAPADSEIKARYDGNAASYTAPEYRTVALIKAEPEDVVARVNLGEDEITAGYEKYKLDYFTPERRTILQVTFPAIEDAQKARDRIAAGTDFMAIATERGLKEADITFADKTKKDFFDPAIADAAFALAEGTVSEPIKGSLATSLLKVAKVAPEHQKTIDEVKDELGNRLRLERAREEIDSIYGAVEDGRGGQQKLEEIATKQNIPFLLAGPMDAAGLGPDGKDIALPHKAELLKAIFESDVGIDNAALPAGDGYVWYDVREVVPSAVKPLDQVRAQVIADITAGKVSALAAEKAAKLVARAAAGSNLETLAQEAGATVLTVQGVKRNETSADFDASAVTALFAVPENDFAFALEADGKGARVMQSQAVLLPPFDEKSEEAKTIAATLQAGEAADLLSAYLGTLQKQAGVSINETLWRQISGTQTQ